MIPKVAEYEVIVVGSGGGGLRAGIGAAQAGAKTLVLSRGKANRSGATLLAGANISADIACDGGSLAELGITDANKDDTKELFYADILHEGFYLNNTRLVELFVEEAPNRIRELMDWGIKVLGTEGERGIAVFGSAILDALYGKAQSLGVEFREDRVFTDLVVEDGVTQGIVCLDLLSGKLEYYAGKAVVLASGGSHNLFRHNSGSTDLCGEGPAAALKAGAPLVDMEMISFCPTVMESPFMYKGNILPYIFHSLGFGSLKNKFGKTFTAKHLPKAVEDLALNSEWNKMLLSYAIQKEINDGGGSMHGGVYFCLDRYPTNLFDELYNDLPSLKTGIYKDIMQVFERGEAVRVSPGAHYFEGGIRIDDGMRTGIPGLFAAGECTGGMFGANRVSAATTEMLVEGAVAGANAARFSKDRGPIVGVSSPLSEIEQDLLHPFSVSNGEAARPLKEALQNAVSGSLMVLRNQEKLDCAFEKVQEVRRYLKGIEVRDKTLEYNREWLDYLELRSMTIVAGAILKAAGVRKESRGVHVREDYFMTDNRNFLGNIVILDTDFNYRIDSVPACRISPPEGVVDYIGGIELVTRQLS